MSKKHLINTAAVLTMLLFGIVYLGRAPINAIKRTDKWGNRIERFKTDEGYETTFFNDSSQPYSLKIKEVAGGKRLVKSNSKPLKLPIEHYVYVSNKMKDDWYVNQHNTTPGSLFNCVPASLEMIQRWQGDFSKFDYAYFRSEYLSKPKGPTYEKEMVKFLKSKGTHYKSSYSYSLKSIISEIDRGNILLVLFLPARTEKGELTNRYYEGEKWSGHAVIISGYAIEHNSGKVFFEVKDPGGGTIDGVSYLGDGRFFEASDLMKGIRSAMWKVYSFSQPDNKKDNKANISALLSFYYQY